MTTKIEKEESDLLNALNNGKLKTIKNSDEEMAKFQSYAQSFMLNKPESKHKELLRKFANTKG